MSAPAKKYRLETLGLDLEEQQSVEHLRAGRFQQKRTKSQLQNIGHIKLNKSAAETVQAWMSRRDYTNQPTHN